MVIRSEVKRKRWKGEKDSSVYVLCMHNRREGAIFLFFCVWDDEGVNQSKSISENNFLFGST